VMSSPPVVINRSESQLRYPSHTAASAGRLPSHHRKMQSASRWPARLDGRVSARRVRPATPEIHMG
jgi:hypothetical protein